MSHLIRYDAIVSHPISPNGAQLTEIADRNKAFRRSQLGEEDGERRVADMATRCARLSGRDAPVALRGRLGGGLFLSWISSVWT